MKKEDKEHYVGIFLIIFVVIIAMGFGFWMGWDSQKPNYCDKELQLGLSDCTLNLANCVKDYTKSVCKTCEETLIERGYLNRTKKGYVTMQEHTYTPEYDYKTKCYYCSICGLENCEYKNHKIGEKCKKIKMNCFIQKEKCN